MWHLKDRHQSQSGTVKSGMDLKYSWDVRLSADEEEGGDGGLALQESKPELK